MFRFCVLFLASCAPALAADPIKVMFAIEDPKLIAGVEYARDQYNATLPADAPKLSSEDYIFFVARSAVESYAAQAERSAKLKAAGLE